ncbi:MAG: sulfite exporter TauE/SafE family protein [Gammaproteobacteria bacterium]|nr:sulfite exporter TauE/SafE family protein [Gammaproteobacteria bacterium]
MIEWIIFALIGILAGLSSGLLGLGGGIIIVPSLIAVFSWQGLVETQIIHMAIGTSLMTIIITSLSSIYAHHQHQQVDWEIVGRLAPGLIIGGGSGAFLAILLTGDILQKSFAVYVFVVVVLMWYQSPPSIDERLLKKPVLLAVGTLVGALSALLGIGGGSFTVPYLVMAKQRVSNAVGTASACGVIISISAVIGFVIFSSTHPAVDEEILIHWQAFHRDYKY